MENLWTSVFTHWKNLTVVGGAAFAIFVWLFPNRKEWKEARREKAESKIDARVIRAISDFSLWKGPRGMTGAGVPIVRSAEIAEVLRLDQGRVSESLERLYKQGKVRKEGGTLDDPSPIWHYAPR